MGGHGQGEVAACTVRWKAGEQGKAAECRRRGSEHEVAAMLGLWAGVRWGSWRVLSRRDTV